MTNQQEEKALTAHIKNLQSRRPIPITMAPIESGKISEAGTSTQYFKDPPAGWDCKPRYQGTAKLKGGFDTSQGARLTKQVITTTRIPDP